MKFNIKQFYRISFWISLIGLISIISDSGFSQDQLFQYLLDIFYFIVLAVGMTSTFLRYKNDHNLFKRDVFIFDLLSISFTIYVFVLYLFVGEPFKTDLLLEDPLWLKLAVFFTFLRESSELKINFNRTFLNPAQLFILSFLFIIILGSLLLLLPRATYDGISYIDALFTSTSAVCVTGLTVINVATHFTNFGQTIILILIQVGGLGILTFASYFGYFFKGATTYENQLVLSDITDSDKIGDVFSTLKYIILITFTVESFSAVLIYSSVDASIFTSHSEKLFFSIFHAISAFCNAGLSTIPEGFYDIGFSKNYYLQLIIILTFVVGGLGFPIVANSLKYIKYRITTLLSFSSQRKVHKPWVLNMNSRITLITTFSISILAFIFFYFLEYNNTLAQHGGFGKIVTALFGATTPRTAGFNTIDTSALRLPTIIMVFLLMWIGASPQSTGGGIKTSTFAIAVLNTISLAKGKSRIEIFRREIADISVRRAFAIMTLSLVVIGFGILAISIFDPEKSILDIAFECFSAYSTVGLSLGITSALTGASKFVVIMVMFIGRISMLSLLIAIFRKTKHKNYRYPTERITIN